MAMNLFNYEHNLINQNSDLMDEHKIMLAALMQQVQLHQTVEGRQRQDISDEKSVKKEWVETVMINYVSLYSEGLFHCIKYRLNGDLFKDGKIEVKSDGIDIESCIF